MPARPVHEVRIWRLWKAAVLTAMIPSTAVTATRVFSRGCGRPSVLKVKWWVRAVCCCAMGHLRDGVVAPGSALHTRCVQIEGIRGRISTRGTVAGSLYG